MPLFLYGLLTRPNLADELDSAFRVTDEFPEESWTADDPWLHGVKHGLYRSLLVLGPKQRRKSVPRPCVDHSVILVTVIVVLTLSWFAVRT